MASDRRPEERDEKNTVFSVLKALAILDCFSAESRQFTVAELAAATATNKATAHRLVGTMVQAGWLMRTGSIHYRPTLAVFRVGAAATGTPDLRALAHEGLVDLVALFGDTGYLMVPDGPRAVCLDKIEGKHPVQINILDVGRSLPLQLGAGPRALLAFQDPDLSSPDVLESIKGLDTSAVADLRAELRMVREQGYSISREDVLVGVTAIGAPAFNADGIAVAAVSLGGLSPRFEGARLDQITTAVVTAANELSSRLGHPGLASLSS